VTRRDARWVVGEDHAAVRTRLVPPLETGIWTVDPWTRVEGGKSGAERDLPGGSDVGRVVRSRLKWDVL
jgi:hypothetical protein